MSFFCQLNDCVRQITIDSKSCKFMVCMDNSGSTAGRVLDCQKSFAQNLLSYFSNNTIVQWDTFAKRVEQLSEIRSNGGTDPNCAIPLMAETQPDFLLFMTDGQVGDVETFRARLLASNIQCPTIVCLTVEGYYNPTSRASTLAGVNMSIVEAFMSASQDVAIVLNFCAHPTPLLLNGTGIFAPFVTKLNSSSDPSTCTFETMAPFDFSKTVQAEEKQKTFVIKLLRTNRSILVVESLNTAVDLDKLKTYLETFSQKDAVFDAQSSEEQMQLAFVLEKLCERMVLPKIDPVVFLNLLHGLSACIERRRMQKQIQEKEFEILQVKMQIALAKEAQPVVPVEILDDEEQQEQTQKLTVVEFEQKLTEINRQLQILREQRDAVSISSVLVNTIARLVEILSAYKKDKTKFTYEMGSARASAATNIDVASLETIGKCEQGECPILLVKENLCILLQLTSSKKKEKTKKEEEDDDDEGQQKQNDEEKEEQEDEETKFQRERMQMISNCTRNVFIDSSLLFGAEVFDIITPGAISVEFAKTYAGKHPLTNGRVIGFLPLAYDLTIFRKYLCMNLCGGKEMFHVVPAYVAMIAKNMRQHQWTNSNVIAHARYILDSLLVRCRFIKSSNASAKKEKIAAAFKAKPIVKGRRTAKHTKTVKKFVKTLDKEVGADEGVTLREAIQHQLTNYRTCLQQVAYSEARSMVNIAIQLMPEFKFPIAQVLSFIATVNSLRVVREAYVSKPGSISIECTAKKNNLVQRMIASMCFEDYHKNKGQLRSLKFQQFLLKSLEIGRFGPVLTRLLNGEKVPKEEMEELCLCVTPSPSYINYQCDAYKNEFSQQLRDLLAKPQRVPNEFAFGGVNILFDAISLYKQCCKSGQEVSFAMLQERLQSRYGFSHPSIYSLIIQRQSLIAISVVNRLVKKQRNEWRTEYSAQYHALIFAPIQGPDTEKEVAKLRKTYNHILPKGNAKKQQRKQKRKDRKATQAKK